MATPTLVQHAAGSNSRSPGNAGAQDYVIQFGEPTQAGNCIIVSVQHDNGTAPTITVSDDQTNTYNLGASVNDTTAVNRAYIFVALNCAAGTRKITVHTTNNNGFMAVVISEFYNVALSSALDGNNGNFATGTSLTAGSFTPTTSGDLIYQVAFNSGTAATASWTPGSQANITWNLLSSDLQDATAAQYGVYTSTAALNPTMSTGTSHAWMSCAIALKSATAGTAPTQAFRILKVLHQAMPTAAANPFLAQIPSDGGDLIVISYNSGGSTISSITSTPSNTWNSTGAAATITGNSSQIYYAAAPSTSNSMTLSITRNNNTNDAVYMIYIMVGAAASPFDVDSGGQTGNQATPATTLTTLSGFSPTNVNGIVFANFAQDFGTSTALTSPSGAKFDSATFGGNSINGPQSVDQNNGWGHFYNSNTNAETWTWTDITDGVNNLGNWAARAAAFKAASGGAGPVTGMDYTPGAGGTAIPSGNAVAW